MKEAYFRQAGSGRELDALIAALEREGWDVQQSSSPSGWPRLLAHRKYGRYPALLRIVITYLDSFPNGLVDVTARLEGAHFC